MPDKYEDEVSGSPVVLPVLDTVWTTYAATVQNTGSKVFTTPTLKYRQRLNGYEITFSIAGNTTASGGGATAIGLPLPSGALIDFAALGSSTVGTDSNDEGFGFEYNVTTVGGYNPLAGIVPLSTTTVGFLRIGAGYITGANLNNANAPQITGKFWVPIIGLSAYAAYGAGLATSVKAGLVSYYDEGTFTANFNGGMTTATNNITVTYRRIGKQVFIEFPQVTNITATATVAYIETATGIIPSGLVPQRTLESFMRTRTAGVSDTTPALITIITTGKFSIDKLSGTWTNAAVNNGWNAFCFSYSVA